MTTKRYRTLPLVFGLCALLLAGCGREAEEVSTETEAPDTTETISVGIAGDDDRVLLEMSREELTALTADEVKGLFEAQLPNYRDIYSIEDGYELGDADWLILRDALIYQMYGVDTEAGQADSSSAAEEEDYSSDPDHIYYAPSREEIEAMSTAEFAQYLNDMCVYFGTTTEIDFAALDETAIEERRTALLETIDAQ